MHATKTTVYIAGDDNVMRQVAFEDPTEAMAYARRLFRQHGHKPGIEVWVDRPGHRTSHVLGRTFKRGGQSRDAQHLTGIYVTHNPYGSNYPYEVHHGHLLVGSYRTKREAAVSLTKIRAKLARIRAQRTRRGRVSGDHASKKRPPALLTAQHWRNMKSKAENARHIKTAKKRGLPIYYVGRVGFTNKSQAEAWARESSWGGPKSEVSVKRQDKGRTHRVLVATYKHGRRTFSSKARKKGGTQGTFRVGKKSFKITKKSRF